MKVSAEFLQSRGCFTLPSSDWFFDLNGCAIAVATDETWFLPKAQRQYRFIEGPYTATIEPPNHFCYYPKARFRVKAKSVHEMKLAPLPIRVICDPDLPPDHLEFRST